MEVRREWINAAGLEFFDKVSGALEGHSPQVRARRLTMPIWLPARIGLSFLHIMCPGSLGSLRLVHELFFYYYC